MTSFQYVSQHDPAVDKKASNLALYRQTLDRSHLVMVPGRTPVVFTLRDLSYEDWQEAMLFHGQPAIAADRAFRAGIVGITGAKKLSDGGMWTPIHDRIRDGENVKAVTPADMKAIFAAIPPNRVIDIGQLLLERAEMERGEGNGDGGAG